MKRVLAIVLVVIVVLTTMCLASAFAEATDEATVEESIHQIDETNQSEEAFFNPETEHYTEIWQNTQNAEPDAETFEALVSAANGRSTLARHENYQRNYSLFHDEEEIFTIYLYMDADTYMCSNAYESATLSRADLLVLRFDDAYLVDIFDSVMTPLQRFMDVKNRELISINAGEHLLETKEAGDGLFVAVTEIDDPETVEGMMADSAPYGGYEYADGMILRSKYTFDIESSDLLCMETFLVDTEGEIHTFQVVRMEYDVADYDPAAEGEPFADYFAAIADPERSRTISVVFNADTWREYTVDCVMPRKCYFSILRGDEFVEHYYTDRECTQLYESGSGATHLVLYVK